MRMMWRFCGSAEKVLAAIRRFKAVGVSVVLGLAMSAGAAAADGPVKIGGGEAVKSYGFAKRLIEEDKVDVVLGGTLPPGSQAAIPLMDKSGTPFVSMATGLQLADATKKWVFKVAPTDRMPVERVFAEITKHGRTKVALLIEKGGFGSAGRAEALAIAPNYGIEIVADETYDPKDPDVTSQLTKIKGIPGVQALFVYGPFKSGPAEGSGPAMVTKNIAQLGLKLPVFQSQGVATKQYIELSGPAAEGVSLPALALLVADKLPANDPQKKVVTDYSKAFSDRWKRDASAEGGYAYDALMIYVEAVKRANSVDKEKVRAELEKTRSHIGITGVYNLSEKDHMGLEPSTYRMLEIRKGDWVLVE
jgi:branched-chain amino acid transport system substrate-binding protein